MEYVEKGFPVYGFCVQKRPSIGSKKAKKDYQSAVEEVARKHIDTPITSADVEVELFYALSDPRINVDVDNVAKPTLDALKDIAYRDDRQVQAIRVVRFDLTKPMRISGRIGPVNALFRKGNINAVWINIYSRTRMHELGGPRAVMRLRTQDYGVHLTFDFDPTKESRRQVLGMWVPTRNRLPQQTRTKRKKEKRK